LISILFFCLIITHEVKGTASDQKKDDSCLDGSQPICIVKGFCYCMGEIKKRSVPDPSTTPSVELPSSEAMQKAMDECLPPFFLNIHHECILES
ncbi:hypothetical protein PMAYCL1PPCAC_09792, partial [Pristionchus mayeri]